MAVRDRQLAASLRALPSVERLAGQLCAEDRAPGGAGRAAATSAARAVLAERRSELLAGARDAADLHERVRARLRPSLRRVLNATGVVIHTNLGRAPLSAAAREALIAHASGYCNLELDLRAGNRSARDAHVRALLCELTGAQDALAVNNGAAAVLLCVAALGAHGPIAISRGQLVEIGGGFRIPDVLAQAGVRMLEVGTTNRTRLSDYERAVKRDGAVALLRVHQSNFRTLGFVEDVELAAMCALGVPVIDDVGSGALIAGVSQLADEPQVADSVRAGAALVCFSADKLLGGPQAGLLVGSREAVGACRDHALARALRIGRLPLAALAATLALYRDPQQAREQIPVLAMLDVDAGVLAQRARRLADEAGGEIVASLARVGGGALPLLQLSGPAVALDASERDPGALAAALRAGEPPLVGRIEDGRVLLDPRTLAEDEIVPAGGAVRAARAAGYAR